MRFSTCPVCVLAQLFLMFRLRQFFLWPQAVSSYLCPPYSVSRSIMHDEEFQMFSFSLGSSFFSTLRCKLQPWGSLDCYLSVPNSGRLWLLPGFLLLMLQLGISLGGKLGQFYSSVVFSPNSQGSLDFFACYPVCFVDHCFIHLDQSFSCFRWEFVSYYSIRKTYFHFYFFKFQFWTI